jgi:SAM-dependent methyltransferase
MIDASRFFTERHQSYVGFIRAVRYPQGLRSFFEHVPWLRANMRVLDAGCGTGVVTLALREAMARRGLAPGPMNAFDLTPAMLERFRASLARRRIGDVALAQADVLRLETLPEGWSGYDLVVTASMLEYVPRERFSEALASLRTRLAADGRLLLFITRRNWLTRPMIGRWWRSNLYNASELSDAFVRAGFSHHAFVPFPLAARYLALWGYAVEAVA